MNSTRLYSRLSVASMLWVFLVIAPLACAASTNLGGPTNQTAAAAGNSKTNAVAATNAAPTELVIPTAEFDLTLKPTKDPFFPLSSRSPVPVVVSTNVTLLFTPSSFTLKGIDGTTSLRLALINNRTLAVGEGSEVTTPTGKFKIHCVEIKEKSVVIRADGQPESIEVFLPKRAQ
jgi:hypothetical protein